MKSIYKYLDTRLFLIGLLVLPFLAVVSCHTIAKSKSSRPKIKMCH